MAKFEVEQIGIYYRVKETETGKYMTKDIPNPVIAKEICDDFNAMSKRDFRPIGGPDKSHTLN